MLSLRLLTMVLVVVVSPSAAVFAQPPSRPAAEANIRQLAQAGQFEGALAAYDRYVTAASHLPDAGLLAIIARAQLDALAGNQDPAIAADALERLASAGDEHARATLRERAAAPAGSPVATAATEALLRLGDPATVAQIATLVSKAPPENRGALIQSLEKSGAASAGPAVAAFLADESPQVRAVAAQAVGALGVRDAVPALQRMFERDEPTVKTFAAVALKKLGQPSVDAYVGELLASEVPQVRLMAAGAYKPSESRVWLPLVRELRNDPNPMMRLQTAERLACCDAATARVLLLEALNSPIPLMRDEAARIIDTTNLADAKIARQLMGDTFEMPRLHGAGIALRLSRAPERGGKR